MKIILILNSFYTANCLQCYTCQTNDPSSCTLQTCPTDGQEWTCQNEIRNNNRNYWVDKGCKQKQACHSNAVQNERAAWMPTQCNPLFRSNSVCRCCCSDKDGCNEVDDFCLQSPKCAALEEKYGLKVACTNDRELKSTCSFSCIEKNQQLVGATENTCELNGAFALWTPSQPDCIAMCEKPSLTNQMSKCTNANFIGSTCSYSCPTGTRLVGSAKRKCAPFGNAAQWNIALPRCEAMCDPEGTTMQNGKLLCSNEHYLNSKCTATCDFKYKLRGSVEKICQKSLDGADWSMNDLEPRCDAICQPLTEIANGNVECSSDSDLGSECTFVCNDRFQLRGHKATTCTRNLTMENGVGWVNPVPYCEPVCKSVPRIPHAVISCTSHTDLGSACTFVCEKGFELVGRKVTTCMLNVNDDSVNWEHGIPYCQQMCTSPMKVQNGQVNCETSSTGISIGNECLYSCDDGFRLVGNASTTCSVGLNGLTAWNASPPFCEPVCGEAPLIDGGSYDCESNEDYSILGQSCQMKCNANSRLHGQDNLVCKTDNFGRAYWSGDRPACIPTCPQRVIHTPPLTVNCTHGRDLGSVCKFHCTSEAQLSGESMVKCSPDAKNGAVWSGDFPSCKPLCPEHPALEARDISCTNGRMAKSSCTIKCSKNGFKLRGNATTACEVHQVKADNKKVLLSNEENQKHFNLQVSTWREIARWNAPAAVCQRISCPNLVKITNGQLACTGNLFEDSCSFKCNDGFTQKGAFQVTCLGIGRWSERLPICEKTPVTALKQCPELQKSTTVNAECSQMRYSGSVCAFSCPTGYSLTGPSSVECLASHKWSSDEEPDCKVRIMVSSWIANHGVDFQPSWRGLFDGSNGSDVQGKSSENDGTYLNLDNVNCDEIQDDLEQFTNYLNENNIATELTIEQQIFATELETFYSEVLTACNNTV